MGRVEERGSLLKQLIDQLGKQRPAPGGGAVVGLENGWEIRQGTNDSSAAKI